ncbi:MAG: class I SAM-dependent methyltransferase [Treponemataceae bacterium]|nr:class I SAM-dependent methyltransferase [Treponemataceae bacterium]
MIFQKKCPLCSGPLSSFEVKNKVYDFCHECSSVFLNLSFYLDDESEKLRYEKHNNSLLDSGYKTYLEKFLTTAIKLSEIEQTERLDYLDYGSGPEPCLCQLVREKKLFNSTWAYDKFFTDSSSIENRLYDFITCLEVAEHFEDPAVSFEHISSLLKKGGFLALQTQFLEERSFEEQIKFFISWWYKEDSTHRIFYTKKGLITLCRQFGLEFFAESKNLVIFIKN